MPFDPSSTSSQFSSQWHNPTDVFSVLLILGGDIVKQALAQMAGSPLTPIAFSFGWVAYSISAVSSVMGENKLMPLADCSCKVINGKSGYVRDNVSWIIGRIVRDFEQWMDNGNKHGPIHSKVEQMLNQRHEFEMSKWREAHPGHPKSTSANHNEADINTNNSHHHNDNDDDTPPPPTRPTQTGLCTSIYLALPPHPGTPGYDTLYYLGLLTILLQLGIASIPLAYHGSYGQLLITCSGQLLAFLTGSLSQWKKEKWEARKESTQNFILTRGNGAQHAIVVLGDGKGLNLEDLSAVPTNVDVWTGWVTQTATILLGVLWVCLLISASGLSEDSWYLMGVGGIGIVENIYVAGRWRTPEAFGIPLEFVEVIGNMKVMDALFAVEEKYPHVGRAMRETFFPGDLFPAEKAKWDDLKRTVKTREKEWKQERQRLVEAKAVRQKHV